MTSVCALVGQIGMPHQKTHPVVLLKVVLCSTSNIFPVQGCDSNDWNTWSGLGPGKLEPFPYISKESEFSATNGRRYLTSRGLTNWDQMLLWHYHNSICWEKQYQIVSDVFQLWNGGKQPKKAGIISVKHFSEFEGLCSLAQLLFFKPPASHHLLLLSFTMGCARNTNVILLQVIHHSKLNMLPWSEFPAHL